MMQSVFLSGSRHLFRSATLYSARNTSSKFLPCTCSLTSPGPGPGPGTITPARNVSLWGTSSKVKEWDKAVSEAEKIVGYPTSFMSLRCLLSDELSNVAMQMHKLVGTGHPLLKTARKFFNDGKHSMQTRGLLVLLMAKTAGPCNSSQHELRETMVSGIYPSQRSLAEITEMINTAVLIHRGVLNLSSLQVNDSHLNGLEFGNKIAVLSGDFILANVSTGLSELNNTHVVEIIASAIADLSGSEFTDFRDNDGNAVLPSGGATMQDWEHQTYLSSGCLVAKSCKSAVMLAHHPEDVQDLAYEFGKNLAYANQLSEEIQAFTGSLQEDGVLNVTSGPVILHLAGQIDDATKQELLAGPVDTKRLRKLLRRSPAINESKDLCKAYGDKALTALSGFQESEARLALQNIVRAAIAV